MKRLLPVFVTLFFLFSCSEKIAQKALNRGEFEKAIELYKKGLSDTDAPTNFKIGEAYRRSNRLKEAAPYYQAAKRAGSTEETLDYQFARSLKANERYDEAEKVLKDYLANPNGPKKIKDLAQYELDNLDKMSVITSTQNYYRIKNLDELNTPNSEYSPVIAGNLLYFTSNRQGGKIYVATGTPFTDIYRVQSKGANVNLRTLEKLESVINGADSNEGSIALAENGTSLIYAKGNTGKATGNSEVNLYFTRFRNNQWLEPRPIAINDPDSWDSTPALTPDGKTLYFASNRPGGFGGTDLYSAQLNRRGRWVDVRNLGPAINTPENEMFPFISEDGRLYFASNGHPGFGNLDMFVATRERGNITIENLGQPMNSQADDFGLYQFDLTRGFFSSNRPGGKGDDDIYTFINDDPNLKIVNYFLEGITVTTDDAGQEIVLPNTKISLMTKAGEVINETFTGEEGSFKFRVFTEELYHLLGEKTDYFSTRKEFTTVGKTVDKKALTEFITNVTFTTKITMDRIVLEKAIVLNNIYYDLDKSDIRPDAMPVLDSLATIMNDNPEIFIELGSHTDARADDAYNMGLSQRRAKSAVDYIIRKGITPERIVAKGYGETQLIVGSANTEEEHQRNRRTEFKVLRYNPKDRETTPAPAEEGKDEYDRFFDE